MRGRKPTPTVLKLLRNNPGRRRVNVDEPQPRAMPLACPSELTEADAQKEWTRVIVPAIERGQVTADDRMFAIAHCELWSTWRSQLAEAARHSHVVAVGRNKYPVPNPARVMANRTLLLLAKVDAELGFSPTARTRVKLPAGKKPQSAVERFKAQKHA